MLPKIASGKQWGVASCNSRAKEEGNTKLGMHSRLSVDGHTHFCRCKSYVLVCLNIKVYNNGIYFSSKGNRRGIQPDLNNSIHRTVNSG